jgi:hypothetical protein
MFPRRPITRKYRPGLESLEPKQLLSGVAATHASEALTPVTRPNSPHAERHLIDSCGTGKGIRFGTS